jgi:hypothetical protein
MREELVAGQDVHDQPDGGQQVRYGDDPEDDAGDDPEPGFLPVDAARVPGDQHGQQREQHNRDHPYGLHPVPGRQRHMQAGHDNDRRSDRPPVLTPFRSRCRLDRGPVGRLSPRSHIP